MNKVTYLFGAGASCEVLPLVKDIPSELWKVVRGLEKHRNQSTRTTSTKEEDEVLNQMIDDYKWLTGACQKHSSIDTFAKKLFIKNEQGDLKRLKLLLSLFFAHRQAARNPDKRYDSFFASIIKTTIDRMPPIKILSWNYDSQFELSFNEFSGANDLEANHKKLRVITKFNTYQLFSDDFSIFKINGTTSFGNSLGAHEINFFYEQPMRINEVPGLIHYYNILKIKPGVESSIRSNLSFAWEQGGKGMPNIGDTTVLVVIGYSFPFFNREIDKQLLRDGMPKLRKVYFQDPFAESVRERFLAIRDDIPMDRLVLRTDTGQFLLPDELVI